MRKEIRKKTRKIREIDKAINREKIEKMREERNYLENGELKT